MTAEMDYTLPKAERLCSQKLIDDVYQKGHRLLQFPYSVRWMVRPLPEGEPPVQMLVVTSKRKFKHAVDRNKVKRLMRECYRLQKPVLHQYFGERGLQLILAESYIHTEILSFHSLYHKHEKLVDALLKAAEKELSSAPAEEQQ
ncbi:MAG: ribonuclease P protein component [Bacteroidales bacterium]|nr:ribonuclease P protein component [Bacteroidales bacterium]